MAGLNILKKNGAPKRSRTSNLQIRSLTLYPVELWARTMSKLIETSPSLLKALLEASL